MNILDTIINLIFPRKCLGCGETGPDLCQKCLNSCPQSERPTPEWIYPLYDYRDPKIKKAIWLLKYNRNKNLVKILGEILYDRMLEELAELAVMENFKSPILIPIPLSPKRKRTRGFNQSELLCKIVADIDKFKNFEIAKDVLFKTKDNKSQAQIHIRKDRIENAVGVFEVRNENKIKNRNIILVDDVTTTGATLNEARKTLRRSGANKIIAFTLAH